nr:hypothetical protein [Tanacetum cinerariifolium]
QVGSAVAQLGMQGQSRVGGADAHTLLSNDGAGVGAFDHAVQGHAGFGLAVDQHPVGRRTATVAWQQRAMQVEAAVFGACQ